MKLSSFTRRRNILLTAAVVLVGVALVHEAILTGVARGLIVEQEPVEGSTLVLLGGDRSYAVAAELCDNGVAREIFLPRGRLGPLVQAKLLPPYYSKLESELQKLGVPPEKIRIADQETVDLWDLSELLQDCCLSRQSDTMLIVSDVFSTRRIWSVLQEKLDPSQPARVRMLAVRDRRFDETNWWRNRQGIKAVVDSYIRLSHVKWFGRPQRAEAPAWQPEELERQLRTSGRVSP